MTGTICAQSSKGSNPPPKPAPAPTRSAPPTQQQRKATQGPPSKGHGVVQQHPPPVHPHSGIQDTSTAANILHDLNVQRSQMQGINRAPISVGTISLHENGIRVIATPDGHRYEVRSDGSIASFRHGNTAAAFRPDGTPRLIQAQGMTISRGPHGEEHFDAELPSGERVVGWGSHDGYVERPLSRGDGHYVQRTYVLGGRQITGVYRTFDYHGTTLAQYVPDWRHSPAFYAWASRFWPEGIHYAWPWRNEAWAAPYRHHFDREYKDLAAWLADYLLAATLQQGQAGGAGALYTEAGGFFYAGESTVVDTGRTPDINGRQISTDVDPITQAVTDPMEDQIRSDVRASAQENEEAHGDAQTNLMPAPLNPKVKKYFVYKPVSTHDEQGDCSLTRGALLFLPVPAQGGAKTVDVIVMYSKPGDCAKESIVPVGVRELQEMRNTFEPDEDAGTRIIQANMDKGILPVGPTGDAQMVQEGQPNPTLTFDASNEIAQQAVKARTIEHAVEDDATAGNSTSR